MKSNQEMQQVANHNLRQVASRNVVKSKTELNRYHYGNEKTDVIAEMDKRLSSVPKFRKDAVKVVNLVLSASPEYFTDKKKLKEWEQASIKWVEDTFGKENIIYAVLHLDEKTPHFHISFTPIFEGKLRASHWFDGPAKLKKIHDSYAKINKPLGISRGVKKVKSTQQELENFYKKVNSSTAYEQNLDRKLDDLFKKMESPSLKEKLNPWGFMRDVVKPLMQQLSKNLSHYRTKAVESKSVKKELDEANKKISDLELKIETLGLDPEMSFLELSKFQVIKPVIGVAKAPQEQPSRQGFEVNNKPRPKF